MSKITAEHLARQAVVYVRHSTQDQLQHNHESRRRQYGLVDRARELGWAEPMVIDGDLGRSGSGVNRPGFERLLRAICEGRVCCFSVYLVTKVPDSAVVPIDETIRDAWVKETVGPWPEACLRPWEPLVVGSALRHPEGRSEA